MARPYGLSRTEAGSVRAVSPRRNNVSLGMPTLGEDRFDSFTNHHIVSHTMEMMLAGAPIPVEGEPLGIAIARGHHRYYRLTLFDLLSAEYGVFGTEPGGVLAGAFVTQ